MFTNTASWCVPKVKRGDKRFQDLVDEMMAHLIEEDMDKAAEEARQKAEAEHQARGGVTFGSSREYPSGKESSRMPPIVARDEAGGLLEAGPDANGA